MAEAAQLIIAIATLVTAVGGIVIGLRNSKHIQQVERSTNGLLKTMGDAREAKGLKEGRAEGGK